MCFKLISSCSKYFNANIQYINKYKTNNQGLIRIFLIFALVVLFLEFIDIDREKNQRQFIEIVNNQYESQYNEEELIEKFPDQNEEAASIVTEWQCDNKEELLFYVREQMLQRTNYFSVKYIGSFYNEILTVETFKDMMEEIFAYDDPNLLKDYDYLRLSWTKADLRVTAYEDYTIYEFAFNYLTTKDEENQLDNNVQDTLLSLGASKFTDYGKIRAVNDYITRTVSYDTTVTNRSAYDAVSKGLTNCRGYSLLAYQLLNELSVPTRIITGTGKGRPHAWNLVCIDGLWYNMDITWDDSTCSDSFFLKNEKDFYFHDRETMFLTEAFSNDYPMALKSY